MAKRVRILCILVNLAIISQCQSMPSELITSGSPNCIAKEESSEGPWIWEDCGEENSKYSANLTLPGWVSGDYEASFRVEVKTSAAHGDPGEKRLILGCYGMPKNEVELKITESTAVLTWIKNDELEVPLTFIQDSSLQMDIGLTRHDGQIWLSIGKVFSPFPLTQCQTFHLISYKPVKVLLVSAMVLKSNEDNFNAENPLSSLENTVLDINDRIPRFLDHKCQVGSTFCALDTSCQNETMGPCQNGTYALWENLDETMDENEKIIDLQSLSFVPGRIAVVATPDKMASNAGDSIMIQVKSLAQDQTWNLKTIIFEFDKNRRTMNISLNGASSLKWSYEKSTAPSSFALGLSFNKLGSMSATVIATLYNTKTKESETAQLGVLKPFHWHNSLLVFPPKLHVHLVEASVRRWTDTGMFQDMPESWRDFLFDYTALLAVLGGCLTFLMIVLCTAVVLYRRRQLQEEEDEGEERHQTGGQELREVSSGYFEDEMDEKPDYYLVNVEQSNQYYGGTAEETQ